MSDKKISQFSPVSQTDKDTTKVPLIQGNPYNDVIISIEDFTQDLKDNYGFLSGAQISGETSDRISGDLSLSNSISTETSTRLSSDSSLSTGLSGEISQRISGDNSLSTLISSDYVPYTGGHSNVDLGVHNIKVNGIKYNTSSMILVDDGDTIYNTANGSLETKLGDLTLQHGQEIVVRCKVDSGTINDMDVVQRVGAQGDFTLVKKANTSEILSNKNLLIGIATTSGSAGDFIWITFYGDIHNVPTGSWTTNQELYFDFNTGGLTNVVPSTPNPKIKLAIVVKTSSNPNASNGIIKVKQFFGNKLQELDDVLDGASTSGQILVWDNDNKWFSYHNINDYALNSSLSTEISNRLSGDVSLSTELSTTTSIAKGAQKGLSFGNYQELVNILNDGIIQPSEWNIGQSIFLSTLNVPDLWVFDNSMGSGSIYEYTTDDQFIIDVKSQFAFNNGYIFSLLETEKVNLVDYATKTYVSSSISTESSSRLSGDISLSTGLSSEISTRSSVDTTLSNTISSEVSSRILGDNSLSTGLSQRVSTDASLSSSISTEASLRTSADASLSTAISQGGGGGSLSLLSDVSLSGTLSNDTLKYDATVSKWINVDTIDILDQVANGEILYNNNGVIDGVTTTTVLSTALVNSTDSYTGTALAKYVITLTAAEYAAIVTKDVNTLYIII